jgi:nucleoside-diphosphate-sugar epimerase
MKPALVTGASGFLGWHVARVLLERGYHVRALVRPGSRVDSLAVEPVTGDLRDPASLARAAAGCGLVFHVAADYRLWAKDPRDLYRSNVDGTRNLLEAARQAGVERVVYTSTVGCIGIPHNDIGDETTPVTLADMTGHYKRSKFQAELVALEFARSGFPVVVVNPTAPVGDHDVKPTPTGKIVVDFLNGDMPAFIDTGLNVVDVRDTAEGHWLACERGKAGERREYDPRPDSADPGPPNRSQGAHHPAALRGSVLCRRLQYRLGEPHRHSAARAPGRGPDGSQEDVGLERKGSPRPGFQSRSRRAGPGARHRVVRPARIGKPAHY